MWAHQRIILFARDVVDMVLSGYLYHLHTLEKWANRRNIFTQVYPQLSHVQTTMLDNLTLNFSLGYQQTLKGMSYKDGLRMEVAIQWGELKSNVELNNLMSDYARSLVLCMHNFAHDFEKTVYTLATFLRILQKHNFTVEAKK